MRYLVLASSMAALIAMSGVAGAQSQPNPLDMIPDKMPFDVPYGAPIGIDRAKAVIAAAAEEAKKHGWKLNIAVVDFGRQSRCLRTHGRRAARVDRHFRAQGPHRRHFSPRDESH